MYVDIYVVGVDYGFFVLKCGVRVFLYWIKNDYLYSIVLINIVIVIDLIVYSVV